MNEPIISASEDRTVAQDVTGWGIPTVVHEGVMRSAVIHSSGKIIQLGEDMPFTVDMAVIDNE